MNILRRWIRYLLGFSRRETNGFLVLMPLMILIIFSQPIYEALTRSNPKDFTRESVTLDSLIAILETDISVKPDTLTDVVMSAFNPNTVSRDQLRTLGFKAETINRMMNYRTKGGTFFIKSDLLKIYGMDSSHFEILLPFIQLPVAKSSDRIERVQQASHIIDKSDSLFDLNTADSMRLTKIYGIGPVLSSRIIRYRTKLGGFVNESQLNEVYGLDSIVVGRLLAASFVKAKFIPHKLNVNQLGEMDLSTHPYLSRSEAKAIVAYRFQHGSFLTVQDIRKIQSISEKTFLKIEPYLTVE